METAISRMPRNSEAVDSNSLPEEVIMLTTGYFEDGIPKIFLVVGGPTLHSKQEIEEA